MEELTYDSVAAKWWADEARKVNEDYEIGLSENLFKDFEKSLANSIKKDVEDSVCQEQSDNMREFNGICLDQYSDIIRQTTKESAIQRTRSVLAEGIEMFVSPALVFIETSDHLIYKKRKKIVVLFEKK